MANIQTVFQAKEIISHKLDMPLVYSWVVKNEKLNLNNINEIILNNNKYPYLSNFVKNAIDNPQITHYLFYYVDANPENSEDIKKAKKIEKIIQEFDQKLRKIFEENGLNYNIKIIHKDETIESAKNLYKKFNSNEDDCEKFIQNIDTIFNNNKFSYKIDTLKILGAFYVQKKENSSALILDFDIDFKDLKLNFNKDNELIKFTEFDPKIISEALIFLPNNDAFQKVFLSFFENKFIDQSLGLKLYIYFKNFILENENINNKDDLLKYLNNTFYQDLLQDFIEYKDLYDFRNNILSKACNCMYSIEAFIKMYFFPEKYIADKQILKDFNEFIKINDNYTGQELLTKYDFVNYCQKNMYFDEEEKKFIKNFHNFLMEKYYIKKKMNQKEESTGFNNEFYFKNLNNEKFICESGESWTENELKSNQTFDIYKQTNEFINPLNSEKNIQRPLEINKTSDKNKEFDKNNKENLISKTSIKNIFLFAFTTSIFLSFSSILITKKIDNNITNFKLSLTFCAILTASFAIIMSLSYYLAPKTQIQDHILTKIRMCKNSFNP